MRGERRLLLKCLTPPLKASSDQLYLDGLEEDALSLRVAQVLTNARPHTRQSQLCTQEGVSYTPNNHKVHMHTRSNTRAYIPAAQFACLQATCLLPLLGGCGPWCVSADSLPRASSRGTTSML